MKDGFGARPEWQRSRAERLLEICEWIAGKINSGDRKGKAIAEAVGHFQGISLKNGIHPPKRLRLSKATLRRAMDVWDDGGRGIEDFDFEKGYSGAGRRVTAELIVEWQKRIAKLGGKRHARQVYRELCTEWKAGFNVPGLGTWTEWWAKWHKREPLPATPPDFPFSYRALLNYKPDPVTRALGNQGIAAARAALQRITRDSSQLRPCELFTLDDVKLDLVVHDDWSGSFKLVRPVLYLMMEIGCRYICGFITRPEGNIHSHDVDALVAHVLGETGLGNGYATHLLFERGAVACSEARQKFLEALFPGCIYVHRTGMNSGRAIAGAFTEESKGRPASKGMIEAFMRKLHIRLSALPGQTGNRYENLPAELDGRIKEAETLLIIEQHTGIPMESGFLRLTQLNAIVRAAIRDCNEDRDHGCQGFHQRIQVEVQPGVWRDTPQIELPAEYHDQGGAANGGANGVQAPEL